MQTESFLLNQWYVAARADEVTDKPTANHLNKLPMVLYRGEDGQVAVLEDRCPHRMARLSMGEVIGNEIQCGYHGARFAADGACTLIPSQRTCLSRAASGSTGFPVIEKYAMIFIWLASGTGGPSTHSAMVRPQYAAGWKAVHGYHYVKGNYQLIIDNLLISAT